MRKLFALVPALLLAGCHSQQVAFQFQPATATAVALATPPASAESAATPPAATAALAPPVAPDRAPKPLRPRQLVAAIKALPPTAMTQLVAPTLAQRPLLRHLGRRHTTEGAAESGLGGIGLFVIGVVVALLAGLAALFALIPGVSFWGGLGLAVAALVVLFLLYSLVGGSKKKKA